MTTTYANGRLPASALADISTPGRLRTDAAASFERLRAAARADGFNMGTSLADHAYRTVARQVAILEQNYDHTWRRGLTVGNGGIKYYAGKTWYKRPGYAVAATPGTSNHGNGLAVDFQGLGGFGGRGYAWMAAHAGEHGWTNTQGRSIGEAWHWVYDPANDKHKNAGAPATGSTVTTIKDRDDMKRKYLATGKDQTLKKGIWTTVRFNDKGDVSVLTAAGAFDSLVQLSLAGMPKGSEAQVRFIRVQTDKDGHNPKTTAKYPITEIVGTGGTTFGQVAQKGSLPKGLRLRVQVVVFVDGVKLTSARVNTDY